MLNLLFRSTTLGARRHSLHLNSVGGSAVGRSLVTLLGTKKKRVVLTLGGPLSCKIHIMVQGKISFTARISEVQRHPRAHSRVFFRCPEERGLSSPRSWFRNLVKHLSSSFRSVDYLFNESRMTCLPCSFPALLSILPHLPNVQVQVIHNFLLS